MMTSRVQRLNVCILQAGMFPVTERRWRVHVGPQKAKGQWEDVDSDSDYVYSGDEEERKNESEGVSTSGMLLI